MSAASLPLNRILCGDSVELMRSFPERSIDLAVTDPPYLVRYRDRDGRSIANDDDPEAVLAAYAEIYRVLKPETRIASPSAGGPRSRHSLRHGPMQGSAPSVTSSGPSHMRPAPATPNTGTSLPMS